VSTASSTPGEEVRHVSGPPAGADSIYAGSFVVGPLVDEPGATGICDEGVADGVLGGADIALEDGATAEPFADDAGADVAEPFPTPDAVSEWLDEHPASTSPATVITAYVMTLPLKVLPTRHHSSCSPGVNAK
jgi:hypothetical protein